MKYNYKQEDVDRIESTFNKEQEEYLDFLFSQKEDQLVNIIYLITFLFLGYVLYVEIGF